VFTALVTASGQAWADFDGYLPKSRAKDPGRRAKAGIPDSLRFASPNAVSPPPAGGRAGSWR
jgi:hypothetical protein